MSRRSALSNRNVRLRKEIRHKYSHITDGVWSKALRRTPSLYGEQCFRVLRSRSSLSYECIFPFILRHADRSGNIPAEYSEAFRLRSKCHFAQYGVLTRSFRRIDVLDTAYWRFLCKRSPCRAAKEKPLLGRNRKEALQRFTLRSSQKGAIS